MATYQTPCRRCGALVDTAASFCPHCGSHSPHNDGCPKCLHIVMRDWRVCPGCGRALLIICPLCGGPTFVQETCESCGGSLMVLCSNRRCGVAQFYDNETCRACGKKIKAKLPAPTPRKDQLR